MMPVERHLLRETITYSEAKERGVNVLHQLGYWSQQNDFFEFVRNHQDLIKTHVGHHLRVSPGRCHVSNEDGWMNGSFNLCVPVVVDGYGHVIIRFPLPYRVGDGFFPGNSDEKVRCEAGTYTWMQQNCPTVPIPRLHGFALSTGQRFTILDRMLLFHRLLYRFRHWVLSLFGRSIPRFIQHSQNVGDGLGSYLIVDYIKDGEMLSSSWANLNTRKDLRENLFRDLSKIMLTMSRFAIPKIGSYIIDDDDCLQLANRPLTLMLHDLENENIPVDMPRDKTIPSVDSYVNSLLSCHDNRLHFQPNAVNSASDCVSQMTALTLMRTVRPQFFDRQLNQGPFVFCLTDLHPSNIFVDKDWHVKYIVDLEWATSLPIEFMRTPIWLTSQAIDEIITEDYDNIRQEFMDIFMEEERICPAEYNLQRAAVMEKSWKLGTFWYGSALRSPTGLHAVFYDRIQPLYSEEHSNNPNFFIITCKYWCIGTTKFIKTKLEEKAVYDRILRDSFQVS